MFVKLNFGLLSYKMAELVISYLSDFFSILIPTYHLPFTTYLKQNVKGLLFQVFCLKLCTCKTRERDGAAEQCSMN